MQHGESATNVSVLAELSPRVTTDRGLADRGIIPEPLPNTTSFRNDTRKETPLE
jgi:hypothetical protein